METHAFALAWIWYNRRYYKLWRFITGGLWVNFNDDTWVRCRWHPLHVGEYITHPQDGGMFSVKLSNIVALENYSWGPVDGPLCLESP